MATIGTSTALWLWVVAIVSSTFGIAKALWQHRSLLFIWTTHQPLHHSTALTWTPVDPVVIATSVVAIELALAILALPWSLPAANAGIILTVLVISSLDRPSVLLHALWVTIRTACRHSCGNLLPLVSASHLSVVAHVFRNRRQHQRRHVVVHVLGGKTKIFPSGPPRTVGAMREEMGVPLDAVILLVPGHQELDDEMQLGEIVSEGHMRVEIRCRGVGGGEEEDEAMRVAAGAGSIDEVRRLLAAGANVNATNSNHVPAPSCTHPALCTLSVYSGLGTHHYTFLL